MPIIYIADLSDPRVADYRDVPDPVLLRDRGLFVAEGRLVVRMLLERGSPRLTSLLVTPAALDALGGAAAFLASAGTADLPVFVASKAVMSPLVGFHMTRGCLGLGERPPHAPLDRVLPRGPGPHLVVALEAVADAANVGAVFRNAVAFGTDAVLLSPTCCDPLYRKAIRVSVGGTLQIPWTYAPGWPAELSLLGQREYTVVALTPDRRATPVDDLVASGPPAGHLALLVGTERAGLSDAALNASTVRVRIPMAAGVDSLNVATATGIALHRLFRAGSPGR